MTVAAVVFVLLVVLGWPLEETRPRADWRVSR